MSSRQSLPIDAILPDLVKTLARERRVVCFAPPGAGKTTRVPAAIVGADPQERVWVLEPRRLAARMSAKRVAEEQGEALGHAVGYEVRFDRKTSVKTRLEFLTEGIFIRRLLGDPLLSRCTTLVFDEFHERHLDADLALGLARKLAATRRPDLKIVIMSATLDGASVARYLGDAPLLRSLGHQHPVTVEFLAHKDERPLRSQVASAVRQLTSRLPIGDILVFLPGAAEIRDAIRQCEELARERDLDIVPLHGDLPAEQQDRALTPGPRRKVILATNVAETSLTIEGIVAVVDSGFSRQARHSPGSGRSSLDVVKISRASAEQRAGRAGRLGPGISVRLYTKGDYDARPEYETPEIERTDLTEATLFARSLGLTSLRELDLLTPPSEAALLGAETLLTRLGALDSQGALSAIGQRMAELPLPPRLGRLVAEGERLGAAEETALVAALLSERGDLYARRSDAPGGGQDLESDLLARVADFFEVMGGGLDRARARELDVDPVRALSVARIYEQLRRLLRDSGKSADDRHGALRRALLVAFPDRVAKRKRASGDHGRVGSSRELLMASGGSAQLAESSSVHTAPWLLAVEASDRRGLDGSDRSLIWLASSIEPEWLFDLPGDSLGERVVVVFDEESERVEGTEKLLYDRLIVDERPAGALHAHRLSEVLCERVLSRGLTAVVGSDVWERLVARVAFVVEQSPDLAFRAGIEPLTDSHLRSMVLEQCMGKRSFGELRAVDWSTHVRTRIDARALVRLDDLAPERIELRSGRRVSVTYAKGELPAIASRLQDFFGTSRSPTVLDGRVPLVLHLLAPNGRDVQVTRDLSSFWANTYPAVARELSRRYPRHSWPTDPASATPPPPRR